LINSVKAFKNQQEVNGIALAATAQEDNRSLSRANSAVTPSENQPRRVKRLPSEQMINDESLANNLNEIKDEIKLLDNKVDQKLNNLVSKMKVIMKQGQV